MDIYMYRSQLVWFNIIIYVFMIIRYRGFYYKKCQNTPLNYTIVVICLAVYSIFAFAEGDTYHYEELFRNMKISHEAIHVEPFYYWLTQLTDSYFIWRALIWGTSSIMFVCAMKTIGLRSDTIGFMLPGFMFYQFSLTRGVFGLTILMIALIYLFNEKISLSRFLIGCLVIMASINLHRSIVIFAIVIPIAVLFPFNKKTVILSLALFPILYRYISIIPSLLLSAFSFGEDTVNASQLYLDLDSSVSNWRGMTLQIWRWLGILMALFISSFYVINKRNSIPRSIFFFAKFAFLLVYISFLFYGQDMSSFISSRTLHAAGFPLMLSAGYYYQNSERSKLDKMTLLIITSYGLFSLFYFMWKFSAQ